MPDYGHVGRPPTYLAVARDFDQFPRHLFRETSTFKSTKVVGCRFSRFQQGTDPQSCVRSTNILLARIFTLMLLTVCAKGSEQLRTTQNKRRFCSCGW